MKRPTIADIARRAGVSKGAVSYALNGQPGVSEATRQRIVAIAQEIGFNPNSAARALSGASARAVGLTLSRPARILGIDREHGPEVDLEMFLGNRCPNEVGRFAEELRIEHGRRRV